MNDRIEKVAMYRASDGSLHESEDQAMAAGMLDDLSTFLELPEVQAKGEPFLLAKCILERFDVSRKG